MAPAATNASQSKNDESSTPKTDKKEAKVQTAEELSDEDKSLKEELELCVTRLSDESPEIRLASLTILRDRIRTATSSLTSVPKPLKMLRDHFNSIVEQFESGYTTAGAKQHAAWFLHAEILSVLGMTNGDEKDKNCLKYRVLAESFTGTRPKLEATNSIAALDVSEDIKATIKEGGNRAAAMKGLGSWGHEYVKRLTHDIIIEWGEIGDDTEKIMEQMVLLKLVTEIVPFFMAFNAETDACDLLMELDRVDDICVHIDKDNVSRVCLYLQSCEPYVGEGDNVTLLKTVMKIRRQLNQYPEALYVALRLNSQTDIEDIFLSCPDRLVQKQLAFIIARQHKFLPLTEMDSAAESGLTDDDQDELVEIMSNSTLSQNFHKLGQELDIMEPKTPDDVYKTHLEQTRPGFGPSGTQVESAKMSLAAAYVNAFVNCGFGKDKVMEGDEGNKFIHRNKDHGMLAATASIGAIHLWDVDSGLTAVDKYLYAAQENIKAGALLGCGIGSIGIHNECDPALALLSDYISHDTPSIRRGAVYGIGLAYAGSNRDDIIQLLVSAIVDDAEETAMADDVDEKGVQVPAKKLNAKANSEILAITALSCGLISVGTCNADVNGVLLEIIRQKAASGELVKDTWYRMLSVGLALPFLCQQATVDPTMETLKKLVPDESPSKDFRDFTLILLDAIAYAATGNVLKIQKFLHVCSESAKSKEEDKEATESSDKSKSKDAAASKEKDASSSSSKKKDEDGAKKTDKKDDKKDKTAPFSRHAMAVLGIGLVAMNEDVGTEMATRVLGSLLRYGEPVIKKTVPLTFAMLCTSNPKLSILDTLSKLSHDNDLEVAQNAIFAMGLVASGTNNARLAQQLRQLSQYYAKDASTLFLVRLTQGLVHLGKGTMTLQPYQGDRSLLNHVSLAGLTTVLTAFTDSRNILLGNKNAHYLLYSLMLATQPKLLQTFDEELKPLQVNVRVGQAVDVVGQAGRPKTITGFQTRTTPVLLGYGERAELATDEYLSLTPILEGFVILRKNPDYDEST